MENSHNLNSPQQKTIYLTFVYFLSKQPLELWLFCVSPSYLQLYLSERLNGRQIDPFKHVASVVKWGENKGEM